MTLEEMISIRDSLAIQFKEATDRIASELASRTGQIQLIDQLIEIEKRKDADEVSSTRTPDA